MAKNKRLPDIRFSGFDQEWDKKQFDTVFDMLSNNTLSRDNLNYIGGSTQNVHYGDILTVFEEYVDADKEQLPFLNDEETAQKYQNAVLKDGDVVIADTAEDEMVGKCIEIGNLGERKVLAGLHTIPCRPKEKYAPKYMGYYLNSEAYHQKLLPLMQGVKVIAISKMGIRGTELILTSDEKEQAKIGEFLSQLDEKIKHTEEKIRKIKVLKQSMLIKMFPREGKKVPDIRFEGFTDDWEQRKLGDVLSLLKDGTHGTHKDSDCGPYLLSAKNIKNGQIIIDDSSDRKISQDAYDQIYSTFKLQKNDVLLTIVGSIGETAILENTDGLTFQRSVAFLRPNEEMTSRFLRSEMEADRFQKELKDRKSQSAQPGVYLGELEKIPIMFPEIEEQEKIGEYFKQLDNLITLHQSEFGKLKNMKSACMKRMFV